MLQKHLAETIGVFTPGMLSIQLEQLALLWVLQQLQCEGISNKGASSAADATDKIVKAEINAGTQWLYS